MKNRSKLITLMVALSVTSAPGDNWAPQALVDGKLLVRGQKELKALQVAQ